MGLQVLVGDDQPVRLRGTCDLLATLTLGSAPAGTPSPSVLIELSARLRPDLTLVAPALVSTSTIRNLLEASEATAIVLFPVITMDALRAARALEDGAAGAVAADSTPPELIDALAVTLGGGGPVVPPFVLRRILPAASAPAWLSPRERDVLEGLQAGLTNSEIAATRFLSLGSVKTYLRRIYKKLGVNGRGAAVAEGLRRGELTLFDNSPSA